jgi:hypothetical protein
MERADCMQWWRSGLRREAFYTTTGLDKSDPVGKQITWREAINRQSIPPALDSHYHHQMVIASDWWAAISQKAPPSDSGLEIIALAADLLTLTPQHDWPATRN